MHPKFAEAMVNLRLAGVPLPEAVAIAFDPVTALCGPNYEAIQALDNQFRRDVRGAFRNASCHYCNMPVRERDVPCPQCGGNPEARVL